jgi:hypothetical protein
MSERIKGEALLEEEGRACRCRKKGSGDEFQDITQKGNFDYGMKKNLKDNRKRNITFII